MQQLTIIPTNPTGYEIFQGDFAIITPEATINLISNPSVETNITGYTAVAGAIAQTSDDQFRGAFSIEMTPNVGVLDGVYYDITLSANTTYTFSCDIKGDIGLTYQIYFADNAGNRLGPVKEFSGLGFWQRQHVIYHEATGAARRVYVVRVSKGAGDSNIFYTDGWQVEAKDHPTTYCDGDVQGFILGQNDFGWNGTVHASTSFRTDETRAGGLVTRLYDIGFRVTGVVGLGMMPVENIAIDSQLGGEVYQNTISQPRVFSIVGTFLSESRRDLHNKRRGFINMIDFRATPKPQPVVMYYTPMDDCGNVIGEPVRIDCTYQSGLGGQINNNFQERLVVTFTQHKPEIAEVRDRGFSIGRYQFIDGTHLFERDNDGNWTAHNADDSVFVVREAPDKTIYVGGDFTNIDGVAASRIAQYNPVTGTWSALGAGVDDTVYDITFDQSGNVFACGIFLNAGGGGANRIAMWNGAAWSALGVGLSGTGYSMAFGSDDQLYVTGSFATAGGVACNSIARWDGVVWRAVGAGSGLQLAGPILGSGRQILFSPPGGNIAYICGGFTIVDGTSGRNSIIKLDILSDTFTVMSSGLSPASGAEMSTTLDGTLYVVGGFTTAGGVSAGQVAKWNGYSFSNVGGKTGVGATISEIWTDNNDNIHIGTSDFETELGGTSDPYDEIKVARWNGSYWNSLPIHIPTSNPPTEIFFDSNNNMWMGTSIAGSPTNSFITVPDLQTETLTSLKSNSSIDFIVTGQRKLRYIRSRSTDNEIFFNYDIQSDERVIISFQNGLDNIESNKAGDIDRIALPGSSYQRAFFKKNTNKVEFYQFPGFVVAGDTTGAEAPQIHEFNLQGLDATNTDNGCLYVELNNPGGGGNWQVDIFEDAAKLSQVAQSAVFTLGADGNAIDVSAVGGSGITGTVVPSAPSGYAVDTDIVVCFSITDIPIIYKGAYSGIDEV